MANTVLAHTSFGVETVAQLDNDALDKLGTWLCEEKSYCAGRYENYARKFGDEAADRVWTNEKKRNGGYCDPCKNFAGELLAKFDLVEGREARIERGNRELGEF
jgi:hypothetical protein